VPELDLDRVRERLRVVGDRVDRDERLCGLKVVGVELEDLLVGFRRPVELLLLVRPELSDLEEERDLRLRLRLFRLLLLEDSNELVPFPGVGVEHLEVVPSPEREVLLLERVLGAPVVRVEREERSPRLDRALVVVQALAIDRAQLGQHLDLRGRVERELGLALQDPASLSKSFARS
jgi:hypothetical protein